MSRRQSVGRQRARTQSTSSSPVADWVTVAVLPPRLPVGFIPRTGVGMADAFGWDETLNWERKDPDQPERRQSLRQKMGLTTHRKRANPDLPPFVMRSVPYETWRKHYAKDKDGNYRGTHAPAEDCLLKPDDLQKWRLEGGNTYADKWTRGKEVLPVYEEVVEQPRAPEYEVDYDGPPRDEPVLTQEGLIAGRLDSRDSSTQQGDDEPVLAEEEEEIARRLDSRDASTRQGDDEQPEARREASTTSSSGIVADPHVHPANQALADGSITHERQQNFKAPKMTWKQKLQKGLEMASMG